ncbi:hypothetical protein C4578_02425 [Candidatus Microgenomates bacterium]|jgi:cytidine deaminase|nr:MAG: hypothetical protein C4578_02425 [Candidatus Microgenomates bacterium]
MKYVKYDQLPQEEKFLVEEAFQASEHSYSPKGHKIGAALLCKNGEIFVGATNTRSRVIGSTCAERMAVDQMFFGGNRQPVKIALVGLFKRRRWTESAICTPCGVCLEMFWETITQLEFDDLDFICASWNKERILRVKLTELFPRVEVIGR